jgi:hypothetical protein
LVKVKEIGRSSGVYEMRGGNRERLLSLRAWPPLGFNATGCAESPPPYVVAGSRNRLDLGAEDDGAPVILRGLSFGGVAGRSLSETRVEDEEKPGEVTGSL